MKMKKKKKNKTKKTKVVIFGRINHNKQQFSPVFIICVNYK